MKYTSYIETRGQVARDAYHNAFEGNPLYDVPGVVDTWWRNQRRRT